MTCDQNYFPNSFDLMLEADYGTTLLLAFLEEIWKLLTHEMNGLQLNNRSDGVGECVSHCENCY